MGATSRRAERHGPRATAARTNRKAQRRGRAGRLAAGGAGGFKRHWEGGGGAAGLTQPLSRAGVRSQT